jgi:hypothetical protein
MQHCCYTYAGILPAYTYIAVGVCSIAATPTLGFCLMKCSRMRGAPLLKSRNSGIWHLVNLPLLSHNNNTMPLRVFTRRRYNVLEAGGTIRGGWRVVWCKPRVPPKIAKIRLRIIRVCRINGVLIRMGRLKSPYDSSLFNSQTSFILAS